MKKTDEFEKIELYLEGSLEGHELDTFRQRLEKDKAFSQMLEGFKLAVAGIKYHSRSELRIKMKSIHKELINEGESRNLKIKWYWAAASLAFLAVMIGLITMIINPSTSHDKLYSQYFTSHEADVYSRSDAQSRIDAYNEGFKLYNQHKYPEVISIFTKIIQSDSSNMELHFYLGISYMEISDYEKALNNFNYIIENKGIIYAKKAQWYLGLCYLKLDEADKAVELFRIIASDTLSPDAGNARKILKKLK